MKSRSSAVDDRLKVCVHCGGQDETRDHTPSRVFLDDPLPANVHVVPACASCNNSFADDEAYVAAVLECALTGSTDPGTPGMRARVARMLGRDPRLAARVSEQVNSGPPGIRVEEDALVRILIKLARGHVAFETGEPMLDEPNEASWFALTHASEDQMEGFELSPIRDLLPEVGSRELSALLLDDVDPSVWTVVQEGRYRFVLPTQNSVRMVLSEYLAAEVAWT